MTREEAINELSVLWERHKCYDGKEAIRYFLDGNYVEALDMAIKALEQEPILDKVRAEIDKQEKWLLQAGYNAYNVDVAFSAIKSVLKESEAEDEI